jgi:hypothetical protein
VAEALLEKNRIRRDFAARSDYQHIITAIRSQLDEATFAETWAEGHAMPLEQAIAYALEGSAVDAEKPSQSIAISP